MPRPGFSAVLTRATVLCGVLLLSACATEVVTEKSWHENLSNIDGYPVREAARVFDYGFSEVFDRALDPPDRDLLVQKGLEALERLEPALDILETDQGRLVVYYDSELIADLPRPDAANTTAWARTYTSIVVAARQVSQRFKTSSSEQVYRIVFEAALRELDPYSRYASRREAKSNRETRNGFTGVGLKYRMEFGRLNILDVIPLSPAARSGLQAGDLITKIDGKPVNNMTLSEVSRFMRGPTGSSLTLAIDRGGAESSVTVSRDLVVAETVTASREDGIGLIKIKSFNQRTAKSVSEAFFSLDNDGVPLEGLILDLRGDPGGLLDQAVAVADLFLTTGEIVSTAGRHPESFQYYSATNGDITQGLPLIILMDGRSASAAEIVVSALQDTGRGLAVGTTSFGKGTIQTVIRLPNDGEITLTWSRFTTPGGYAIQNLGVLPAVCLSGQTEPNIAAVLSDLRSGATALLQQTAAWRSVALSDTAARTDLRDYCPAELRRDNAEDVIIARALLEDPALYAGTLGLQNQVALELEQQAGK